MVIGFPRRESYIPSPREACSHAVGSTLPRRGKYVTTPWESDYQIREAILVIRKADASCPTFHKRQVKRDVFPLL